MRAMRRRTAGLVLAVTLGLAGLTGAPARAETLADAFVLAYRHSDLLEKNRAVLRAADEGVAQAIATLRPIIDYTVSAQRSWVFPNDVSVATPAGRQTVVDDTAENTASIGLSA